METIQKMWLSKDICKLVEIMNKDESNNIIYNMFFIEGWIVVWMDGQAYGVPKLWVTNIKVRG